MHDNSDDGDEGDDGAADDDAIRHSIFGRPQSGQTTPAMGIYERR